MNEVTSNCKNTVTLFFISCYLTFITYIAIYLWISTFFNVIRGRKINTCICLHFYKLWKDAQETNFFF